MRRWLVAAVLLAAWIVPAGYASYRVAHPPRHQPKQFRLQGEPIRFTATDGLSLVGRWRPAQPAQGTIILLHAYGVTQNQMAPMQDFLHRAGYNTLSYDARAHGESEGTTTTIGVRERHDLGKALDWLATQGITDRIGALGISMGAATSLFQAADDPRLEAIVSEGCFSAFPDLMATSFPFFFGLPKFPYASLALPLTTWQMGVGTAELRPIDAIARLGSRPVLVIGGMKDAIATPDQTLKLARHYTHGQLWLVPEATHCQSFKAAPDEYARRVTHFFQAALSSQFATAPAVVPEPVALAARP